MARRLPDADRLTAQRMLTRPAAQPALIADLRESYRQGTTVMAADLLRYSRPWGFRLDDVTTTVHLWHGEQTRRFLSPSPARWRPAFPVARRTSGPVVT